MDSIYTGFTGHAPVYLLCQAASACLLRTHQLSGGDEEIEILHQDAHRPHPRASAALRSGICGGWQSPASLSSSSRDQFEVILCAILLEVAIRRIFPVVTDGIEKVSDSIQVGQKMFSWYWRRSEVTPATFQHQQPELSSQT